MQQWEYTTIQLAEDNGVWATDTEGGSVKVDDLDRYLNITFGDNGWELVATTINERAEWLYFKRPKG